MRDKILNLAYHRCEMAYLLVVQALGDMENRGGQGDVVQHLTRAAGSLEAARNTLKRRRCDQTQAS